MSVIIDVRLGGVEDHYLSPPKDINMRFPERALSCVGFFARDRADIEYGGTGFIVRTHGRHGNSFLHLVTAKHVVEKFKGPWLFGMNDKEGNKILLKSGGIQKWWAHPTEESSVDCSVTLFAPSMLDEYDFSWIDVEMFASPSVVKEAGIGVGDEVNVLGLFASFHGRDRHLPILRSGNIAMMPTEPVPVENFGDMDANLIDATITRGLSGAPVFVRQTLHVAGNVSAGEERYMLAPGRLYLLGLLHGHWKVDAATAEQLGGANAGVSVVVPAKKIFETINHPELVQLRKDTDEQIAKAKLPTMDFAEETTAGPSFTKVDFENALRKVSRKIDPEKS